MYKRRYIEYEREASRWKEKWHREWAKGKKIPILLLFSKARKLSHKDEEGGGTFRESKPRNVIILAAAAVRILIEIRVEWI